MVVHELCNPVHPNYSKGFGVLVRRFDAAHKEHSQWLKFTGTLH
ncbi:hypothetical protein SynRS9902_01222 [Synechococcus sp. RS9902]|nr:hypothetical protein SynRS9902_01222 [Synechococcus sp. RS9902]